MPSNASYLHQTTRVVCCVRFQLTEQVGESMYLASVHPKPSMALARSHVLLPKIDRSSHMDAHVLTEAKNPLHRPRIFRASRVSV
jgi:hypothetical protein